MVDEYEPGGRGQGGSRDSDPVPAAEDGGANNAEGAAAKEGTPLVKNQGLNGAKETHSGHASEFHAFVNTFKAFIGAGVLSMPYGFRTAGWLGGLLVLGVVALTSAYTAKLLLRAKRRARRRAIRRLVGEGLSRREAEERTEHMTYPELGREALPEAQLGERTTAFFLALTQLGSCTAYIIFMANNMAAIDPTWPGRWAYVLVLVPPLVLLSLIRDIDLLFPLSLAGTALLVLGLAVIGFHFFSEWAPPETFRVLDLHGMVLFTGMAIFAMVRAAAALSLSPPRPLRRL